MLTSRARVRRCLAREPVDRIPNGLGGAETAGLHLLTYDRLKKTLGVDDPKNRMTTFMTTALVEPPVLDAMDGDIILLSSRMCPARFWGPGNERGWKDITFWGCLGSQSTIPFGTPESIKAEVRKLRREMSKGGGYILGGAKQIQPGTPVENAVAVIDAFTER